MAPLTGRWGICLIWVAGLAAELLADFEAAFTAPFLYVDAKLAMLTKTRSSSSCGYPRRIFSDCSSLQSPAVVSS